MGNLFWAEMCGCDIDDFDGDCPYCGNNNVDCLFCDRKKDPVIDAAGDAAAKAAAKAKTKVNRKRYKSDATYEAACDRVWHEAYGAELMRVDNALRLVIDLGLIDPDDIRLPASQASVESQVMFGTAADFDEDF